MPKYCYFAGKIIPESKAKISVTDIGLLRGYAVFDFLRTFGGKPFLLDEHLTRLEESAAELNLKLPLSKEKIAHIIAELVQKNQMGDITIKTVLTGGPSPDGMKFNPETSTFFILTNPLPAYQPELFTEGVKMITFDHLREKALAKTTNYITKLSLDELRQNKHAYEILFTAEDFILEGATCNFFIFRGDALITPKDDILVGTIRNLVLKLAAKKFRPTERLLPVEELCEATEAFITSTTRGIVPVVQIDDRKIGDGKVGKNTKYLIKVFNEFTQKN